MSITVPSGATTRSHAKAQVKTNIYCGGQDGEASCKGRKVTIIEGPEEISQSI